jgi:hypothetical protein
MKRDPINHYDVLSPIGNGGTGTAVILLSVIVYVVGGIIFPTAGLPLEPYRENQQ